MKSTRLFLYVGFLFATGPLPAATLYVDAANTNPIAPYTNWATAAAVIQDAVDAAAPGDTVLVTNGLYAAGGRAVYGTTINRVAAVSAVTVRSVNGPQFTIVQGALESTTVNIRCALLGGAACLSGFTLTNGSLIWWAPGSIYEDLCGGGVCCFSSSVVSNCVIAGNQAFRHGGGAYGAHLHRCTVVANSASGYGGGAAYSTLNNCHLANNSASDSLDFHFGGGAYHCGLTNCILQGNSADGGGGAYSSTLCNCLLSENSAVYEGGGAWGGYLINCTFSRNSASSGGGGIGGEYGGACLLSNCILYDNTAETGPNHYNGSAGTTLNSCCTTPMPTNGTGNITNAPLFVDPDNGNFHLQSNSPCINAGNNDYAPGPTDLDGNPRIVNGTVDMGAYEWQVPARFAPLAPPGSGGLALSLSGETNRVYAIQASSNLVNWLWLGQFTNVPGQPPFVDTLTPPPPVRFYKASPVP